METALFTDVATLLMTVVVVLAFTCMSYFAIERRKPMNNASIRIAVSVSEWSQQNNFVAWLLYGHISDWDTSQVTDMSFLFKCDHYFNENIVGGTWPT